MNPYTNKSEEELNALLALTEAQKAQKQNSIEIAEAQLLVTVGNYQRQIEQDDVRIAQIQEALSLK